MPLTKITPEQQEAIENELRRHHLLGTGKAMIGELSQRQKDAFYTDLGKFTLIIQDVNKSADIYPLLTPFNLSIFLTLPFQ